MLIKLYFAQCSKNHCQQNLFGVSILGYKRYRRILSSLKRPPKIWKSNIILHMLTKLKFLNYFSSFGLMEMIFELFVCNYEEADIRMIYHASVKDSYLVVSANDSDVFGLGMYACTLDTQYSSTSTTKPIVTLICERLSIH